MIPNADCIPALQGTVFTPSKSEWRVRTPSNSPGFLGAFFSCSFPTCIPPDPDLWFILLFPRAAPCDHPLCWATTAQRTVPITDQSPHCFGFGILSVKLTYQHVCTGHPPAHPQKHAACNHKKQFKSSERYSHYLCESSSSNFKDENTGGKFSNATWLVQRWAAL